MWRAWRRRERGGHLRLAACPFNQGERPIDGGGQQANDHFIETALGPVRGGWR